MTEPSATSVTDVRLEQLRASDWADAASGPWNDPQALWEHLTRSTNIVRAAREFDWTGLIRPGGVVLDLGAGSGWLSGMLSARSDVSEVIAWDGSERMLAEVLPGMVELGEGDQRRSARFVVPSCHLCSVTARSTSSR